MTNSSPPDPATTPPVPGAPGAEPPTVEEPTEPRPPVPPKPDQRGPKVVTATGVEVGDPDARMQQGAFLTTAQGARLHDTDHSLKAGERGPTLLQDHHLREKIMHFDHERIPERVVHARGTGAHGHFESYGTAANVTQAAFLAEGVRTPVFTRFSQVVGALGSPDAVRDTRGFATKFYTQEGVFDLVGNNMPVFFIQDGIKFPDIVHAAKPHPDRDIPQAQSAHDTFWDFVSLHTEAQHHTMWQMSDRGIPRSYRMMEGFGVHTFRLVAADGSTSLVKFHWKPKLGAHSLVWEEAQMVNGVDPDYLRRDLYDAIEAGAYPQWELGIQVMADTPEQMFEGIDLLDPTKIVPEELAPVQPIGLLTLDAAPRNFFAEVEQVAFHPGHLVPGIDVTDDPLLQARLFSYLDTQITRLGGPNFAQIPVNRTHAPVNDMLRDGFHQDADYAGVAPYRPNSLDGGCPFVAGVDQAAFIDVPQPLPASTKVRAVPASFADHHTQARLFWLSMTAVEKDHIIGAYSFELGKCYETAVRERQLASLALIDPDLCAGVATALGLPTPAASEPLADPAPSPALSQVGQEWPVDGRTVGIVVDSHTSGSAVQALVAELHAAKTTPLLIAPTGGPILLDGADAAMPAQRSLLTARSVEFDAVVVAAAPVPGPDVTGSLDAKAMDLPGVSGASGAPAASGTTAGVDPRVLLLVTEAYRHGKAIAALGVGSSVLDATGIAGAPGVLTGAPDSSETIAGELLGLMRSHRVWNR